MKTAVWTSVPVGPLPTGRRGVRSAADFEADAAGNSAPDISATAAASGADGAPAELVGGERRTGTDVIRRLLTDGPSTAARLAAGLGVSGTAVRRHLDVLVAEGAVTSREETVVGRRGRGRPARVYLLTDIGRARLPHAYDDLAAQALGYLAERGGAEAISEFARRRARRMVDEVRPDLAAAGSVSGRARVLAGALTKSGYAASVDRVGVGAQLCQHHCPVAHVAARYPQLCEEELAVFTEALGTYAQRLATIARGDSFCTTFIPAVPPDDPAPPVRPRGTAGGPSGRTAPTTARTRRQSLGASVTQPLGRTPLCPQLPR